MSETAAEHDRQHTTTEQPRPSVRVVEAVADASGADAADLDPLYDVVDPDALDALFVGDVGGRVAFDYCGCEVVLRADGRVLVDGAERAAAAGGEQ